MSIDLTTATQLQNASIQYTYPEMDIRSIVKTKNIITFKFRNGLSSSSFSFTDTDNSIFKSGIASEGTISTSIHKTGSYELTIKHITSTQNDFFYVVFPIESGDKTSFINSIANSSSSDINVINMSDAENKSLNSMITDSGSVYKYTSTDGKTVFVFGTPIKTDTNDITTVVTSAHSLWNITTQPTGIKSIGQGDNEKVSEEIVCDYSGDSIEEPSINNKDLSTTFSKVGSISIFFAVFALYAGSCYFIFYNRASTSTEVNTYIIFRILSLILSLYAMINAITRKNINFLNINFNKPDSFYALLFIPLWEFVYRCVAIFIYIFMYNGLIGQTPTFSFIQKFILGHLNDPETNQFLLGLLLVIWVLFVCVILVK